MITMTVFHINHLTLVQLVRSHQPSHHAFSAELCDPRVSRLQMFRRSRCILRIILHRYACSRCDTIRLSATNDFYRKCDIIAHP